MLKKCMMVSLIILALCTLVFPPCAVSKTAIKEGNWEITATIEIPGMPFPTPPQAYITCLTDANPVPADHEQGNCTVGRMEKNGDSVIWTASCTDENGVKIDSRGEITYRGDTFEGIVTMDLRETDGSTMQMKNKMTGKYLGPCSR